MSQRSSTANITVLYTLAILLSCMVIPFTPLNVYLPAGYLKWDKKPSPKKEINGSFQWSNVQPSKHLLYTPCFDGLHCARLDVPLNWNANNTAGLPRAAVALIKVPARVPVTDARYGGVILLNPGGPGNSGVHQAIRIGRQIQEIVDSALPPTNENEIASSARYFDIIGFDSRGVNNTTPRVKCFPDEVKRQEWDIQVAAEGLIGRTDRDFSQAWSRAKALGKSCSQETDVNGMGRYLNTAQVVEDMVDIIEKHGEWRQAEAHRLIGKNPESDRQAILDRSEWHPGQELLQYWGFSYGTILGATFAAMHPERISRAILDGVVDVPDYYESKWLRNLLDTDQIIQNLCEYCYTAGPEGCPLFTGTSASDIQARIDKIIAQIKEDPIPVAASEVHGPDVINYTDVVLKVVAALYAPTRHAESLFQILSEVESGNGSSLSFLKQQRWNSVSLSAQCEADGPFSEACLTSHYIRTDGPFPGIACMDGESIANSTKDDYREYIETIKGQSRWMSEYWAMLRLGCVGWTIRPEWTFKGPIQGITSQPMLFIGNTLDPVTPLVNAHSVSALFPGSVVLQYDVEGHCTLTTPSMCTLNIIRQYFQNGELPRKGKVCPPYVRPFVGCIDKDGNGNCQLLDGADKRMLEISKEIITRWP